MEKNEQTLARLLSAQRALERIALSKVSQIAWKIKEHDVRLERATEAVSGPSQHTIFTDFYIRHIDGLVHERTELVDQLSDANARFKKEKLRHQKLQTRTNFALRQMKRKSEELEFLDRMNQPQ